MASPSSAVKRQTSIITTTRALVAVRETFGLSGVLPGLSFMTPVELAIASTPERARTMPTKAFQL